MKKFVVKIITFFLALLLTCAGLVYFIDPYNVFHPFNIRDNGVEPNKNYIKMKYILANPGKFDALLFGSSRVGTIHTDTIEGERCYNMTYSKGLPCEHLANLKTLVNSESKPSKVYIGLDSQSYTTNPRPHNNDQQRSPYEYYISNPKDFWSLYINPTEAVESLFSVTLASSRSKADVFVDAFYSGGWFMDYGQDGQEILTMSGRA